MCHIRVELGQDEIGKRVGVAVATVVHVHTAAACVAMVGRDNIGIANAVVGARNPAMRRIDRGTGAPSIEVFIERQVVDGAAIGAEADCGEQGIGSTYIDYHSHIFGTGNQVAESIGGFGGVADINPSVGVCLLIIDRPRGLGGAGSPKQGSRSGSDIGHNGGRSSAVGL